MKLKIFEAIIDIVLMIALVWLIYDVATHMNTGDCIYQHQYESDYLAPYGESVAACTKEEQ